MATVFDGVEFIMSGDVVSGLVLSDNAIYDAAVGAAASSSPPRSRASSRLTSAVAARPLVRIGMNQYCAAALHSAAAQAAFLDPVVQG
jgi:hypothetical protein